MDDPEPLVYLVHCESDVLLSLYDVLSAAGFRVEATSNALDALGYVERTRPRVILCHWEMPQMEGPELLTRLRKSSPESRIIMTSRNADGVLYDQVSEMGGDDLLREPFNDIAVVHVVSRMLRFSVPYPDTSSISLQSPASSSEGRGPVRN